MLSFDTGVLAQCESVWKPTGVSPTTITIFLPAMSRKDQQVSLFTAFSAHGVEYAVVGGIAVNAHGVHRYTRDLDIFIRPTPENAAAAYKALIDLGAKVSDIEPNDILNDEQHFQLQTEYGPVDILSSIGEMSFEQVWSNRVELDLDGLSIWFISRDDLIVNKLQTGRHQDLADAEQLQRIPELGRLEFPEE